MEEVELIIKMPKIEYEHLTNEEKFSSLEKDTRYWLINKTLNRVAEGTLLPEGHERTGDEEEIIKGLESVKEECGRHLNEGFAWICEPIDKAIKALKKMEATRTIETDKEDEVKENFGEPEEDMER